MHERAAAVRQILRRLGKRPGFTFTAIAVLALGIGANVAIFSAVEAVLLRPLPYPEPGRLAALAETVEGGDSTFSPPNFADLQAQTDSFAAMAAFHQSGFTLSGEDRPAELVTGAYVTGGFFEVMAVAPALGRPFSPAELEPGAPPTAILAHDLWRRRYAGDPAILGRRIEIDGAATQVVGVMPPGFAFPAETELWAPRPFSADDLSTQRGAHYLDAVARLTPEAGLDAANAQLAAVGERLATLYPENNTGRSFVARDLRETLVGDHRQALWMLVGAVGLVLLVACLNVSNLLLARFLERRQELAVRAALGAAPGQVVRDVLAEGLVVAALGGLAALAVAHLAVAGLAALESLGLPRFADLRLDRGALLFGLALTAVAGLVAAGLPALRLVAGGHSAEGLGTGARTTGDRASHRLRSGLVVAEVALAVVLVFGAGLLGRSFWALQKVDPGFDPEGVLTVSLLLNENDYPEAPARAAFMARLMERIAGRPGIEHAGAVFGLPFSGLQYVISVERLDGRPAYDEPGSENFVHVRVATPGYLQALGIPVVAGRAFTAADRVDSAPVVLVNRTAARLLWPSEAALGRTVELGTRLGQGGERAGGEVVGVVGDVLYDSLAGEPLPELYVAHAQFPMDFFSVAVKTQGDPAALAEEMRAAVAALDPRLPLFQVLTMEQRLASSVAETRLYALLLGLFAATALALSTVGLYGLMAYTASQRIRDVGIRMALGASRERIVSWMLRQGLALTAAGAAIGVLAAMAGAELLRSWLFGLEPDDPLTLLGAALVLGGAGLAATLAPARRASRVDPVDALRSG